jgi:cytochrome c biogenesis protein CcmG, thiol:disulfide interchange protein DsbE
VLLACQIGALAVLGAEAQLKVGDVFPDVTKYPLEGSVPAGLAGKVVVVDFWASWCGRCKGSFELLEQLHQRFAPRGLVILSINVDESRAAMEAFLKEHPVSFPVLRDKTKALVRALNIPSMPTLLVVDSEGRVRSIHGSFPSQEARTACIQAIEALLKPRKAT